MGKLSSSKSRERWASVLKRLIPVFGRLRVDELRSADLIGRRDPIGLWPRDGMPSSREREKGKREGEDRETLNGDVVEQGIGAASKAAALPAEPSNEILARFGAFGRTLRDDESIVVAQPGEREGAVYDRAVRRGLVDPEELDQHRLCCGERAEPWRNRRLDVVVRDVVRLNRGVDPETRSRHGRTGRDRTRSDPRALIVEFTEGALGQIEAAAAWWRANHPYAPALFEAKLGGALAFLRTTRCRCRSLRTSRER
jgi:hypothetical protein